MVSSVADDALSPDEGTSCDLEKTVFESEVSVKGSVNCVPSSRYGQFFEIDVNQIYRELICELEGKIEHLLENCLLIDLAFIETKDLEHLGLNSDNKCVETLTIVSSGILDTKKTDETTKVSSLPVTEKLQEVLLSLFGRHAFLLDCFICRSNTISTRSTDSAFRSICKKEWNFQRLLLSTRLLSPLCGATMEVRCCNSHPEENSSDCEELLNIQGKKQSPMQEPSCTLCHHRLGCRIPSVTMTTDAVLSPHQHDCLYSPSKESSTLLPLSDGHVRRLSLIQNRETPHEGHHPMQNIINNYSHCKNNMNNCISTSCQSSSHNQCSRSRTVVSVNSSHQRIRKCRNIRRSNSSSYVNNCSRSVIVYSNRTIGSNTESSLIYCRSMPVFEGNCCLPSPYTAATTAPELQPRRWSLSSPSPRSRSTFSSEGVLNSSWCPNTSRTHQSSSSDDTSLSSSITSFCCPSERLTQKNCSRRRRAISHRRQVPNTRPSDHFTNLTSNTLEFRRDGGQLGLDSHSANLTNKIADVTPTSLTSLLPVPYTGDSSRMESGSYFHVSIDSGVTSTEESSTLCSVSLKPSLHRQQALLPPCGKLLRTSSSPASRDASQLLSSVDSNTPHLRQTQFISTVEQVEMESQHSPIRHRSISKRSQRIHPLLVLWNLLTQTTYSSSANRRDGTTSVKMLSQVWTCLLSLMLVVTVLPNVAECCSSRSTPRPRPSSPTLRPNITFQTYACPPAYAAWYCLNGATCFTVKIGESILYNCECAEGYMGQRCEFKDLDGSYLPTREKVLLETASIAGGATVVIVLVFFVIFSVFLVKNREKETRDLEGFSRINININSGAASSWPASGGSGHHSPSYSQRTSHSFVTSSTGALATSPHTTTISLPPHHMQPGQGCSPHYDSQHGRQAESVPTESVVDGKRFVSVVGGGGGSTVVDGGMKGRYPITPAVASTVTAGEAFYGVPARVVRTVTTITDLASIYTNPRQEVHQVEVLQQVNVLKVDQSKACYNATFVRPSSNATTTALFRGPMWQEASHSPDDKMSSAPLSWQSFKATSWLSSSSPFKTQDRLSVMPKRNTPASDQAASDMVPQVCHVVLPFREQRTRVAHSAVTLAMSSHAAELDGREQLQPSSTTQILGNSKMPLDLNSELHSRLSVNETNASSTVDIAGNDGSAKDGQRAHDISTTDCTANDFDSNGDSECSRATGAVNQAFDSGEDNIVNRSDPGAAHDCDNGPRVSGDVPQPIFGAKYAEQN